jgi:hypothetical protein
MLLFFVTRCCTELLSPVCPSKPLHGAVHQVGRHSRLVGVGQMVAERVPNPSGLGVVQIQQDSGVVGSPIREFA